MGFREGSGLGKDGSGRAEPVSIGIGNGRLGLGVMEEKRRELEEAFQNQKRAETSLRESFLDSKKRTFETSKVLRDLEKAQKACEELDVASGILQSDLWTDRTTQEGQGPSQDVAEVLSALFLLFCPQYTSLLEETISAVRDCVWQRSFRDAGGATYVKTDATAEPAPQLPLLQDASSITSRFRRFLRTQIPKQSIT